MRRAASRCTELMASMHRMANISSGSRGPELVAGRQQLGAVRRLAGRAQPAPSGLAAVAGEQQPQQHPPRQQPQSGAAAGYRTQQHALPAHNPQQQRQPPPQQQQHHHHHRQQYESMRRHWNVKRTPLDQFPDEVQQRILAGKPTISSGGGSSSGSSGAVQARMLATTAAAPPAGPWPAALVADLQKLLAALEYERKVGFVNVMGSVEKVPVAAWASRHLLAAAGELLEAPAAAQQCSAAAQQLQRYGGMESAERPAVVAAAEAAVRQALASLQQGAGSRSPAGQQQQQQTPRPAAASVPGSAPPALQPTQPAATHAAAAATTAAAPVPDQELDAAAEEAHAEEVGQAVPTPEGEEYVMSGNRRIKATTVAFRRSFAEAAAALEEQQQGAGGGVVGIAAGGEQRSAAWFRLRERRLTASAFSKAVGLFEGDRQQLWGEKVGLVEPFKGNAATAWGTTAEPRALAAYEAFTGQHITNCMFQVKHDDPVHGWLGASPDGIIESLALDPTASPQQQQEGGLPPPARGCVVRGGGPVEGAGRGILEIKCPFNKGQPELAVPPQHATWYYMPQVQGLLYIFDCEWCNLYIWTSQGGSAVYHIRRDRAYWGRLWGVLADFWWNHVVPARQEFAAGRWEEVEQYRPPARIEATEELRQWSKRMALAAPVTFFRHQPQTPQHTQPNQQQPPEQQ